MTVRQAFLFALAATYLNAATVAVDVARDRHPIKPEIYGVGFATASQLREMNIPLNRWGGNATSRYNWQIKATNHASDYDVIVPGTIQVPAQSVTLLVVPSGAQPRGRAVRGR